MESLKYIWNSSVSIMPFISCSSTSCLKNMEGNLCLWHEDLRVDQNLKFDHIKYTLRRFSQSEQSFEDEFKFKWTKYITYRLNIYFLIPHFRLLLFSKVFVEAFNKKVTRKQRYFLSCGKVSDNDCNLPKHLTQGLKKHMNTYTNI